MSDRSGSEWKLSQLVFDDHIYSTYPGSSDHRIPYEAVPFRLVTTSSKSKHHEPKVPSPPQRVEILFAEFTYDKLIQMIRLTTTHPIVVAYSDIVVYEREKRQMYYYCVLKQPRVVVEDMD